MVRLLRGISTDAGCLIGLLLLLRTSSGRGAHLCDLPTRGARTSLCGHDLRRRAHRVAATSISARSGGRARVARIAHWTCFRRCTIGLLPFFVGIPAVLLRLPQRRWRRDFDRRSAAWAGGHGSQHPENPRCASSPPCRFCSLPSLPRRRTSPIPRGSRRTSRSLSASARGTRSPIPTTPRAASARRGAGSRPSFRGSAKGAAAASRRRIIARTFTNDRAPNGVEVVDVLGFQPGRNAKRVVIVMGAYRQPRQRPDERHFRRPRRQ